MGYDVDPETVEKISEKRGFKIVTGISPNLTAARSRLIW